MRNIKPPKPLILCASPVVSSLLKKLPIQVHVAISSYEYIWEKSLLMGGFISQHRGSSTSDRYYRLTPLGQRLRDIIDENDAQTIANAFTWDELKTCGPTLMHVFQCASWKQNCAPGQFPYRVTSTRFLKMLQHR